MFRLTLKFGLHRVSRTDQPRKSRTPCTVKATFCVSGKQRNNCKKPISAGPNSKTLAQTWLEPKK